MIVFLLALLVLIALGLAAAAIAMLPESTGAAVFLFVMAAFLGGLGVLVGGETVVRWRTRIQIHDGQLRLTLPRRRSMVPLPAVDTSLRLADVRAVETRTEAFRGAGNTALQQAYSLRVADDTRIVLGADRRMVDPFFATAAATIADLAGLAVTDRGTIDGSAGKLMLAGQTVPDWDTPGLPPAAAERRVRQEANAWHWVRITILVVIVIRALIYFL